MKTITIEITQEDIDKGKRRSVGACPAALALSRAFNEPMWIYKDFGKSHNSCGRTPLELFHWIRDYDHRRPVSPGKFELIYDETKL